MDVGTLKNLGNALVLAPLLSQLRLTAPRGACERSRHRMFHFRPWPEVRESGEPRGGLLISGAIGISRASKYPQMMAMIWEERRVRHER